MLGLLSQQYDVCNPEGDMIEVVYHSANVLEPSTLLLLSVRQANVPHQITWPDRGEHYPIDPRQLLRDILVR